MDLYAEDLTYVLPGSLRMGAILLPKMKLAVFAVLLVVIGLTYLALTRTWIGRAAFAYAQNPEAAALMGVKTDRLQTIVTVYSTALAGLGGALYASLYSLEPTIGAYYVLKAVELSVSGGHRQHDRRTRWRSHHRRQRGHRLGVLADSFPRRRTACSFSC